MKVFRVIFFTIVAIALPIGRAVASCAITDPSPYNDISSIYFLQMDWTPGSTTEGAPASLRAGNVIVHADATEVHLGGKGPNLGETIYRTTDPSIVVFDRLVTVLREHHFYSMSSPSQNADSTALTYTITVERCGRETTLSAVRLKSEPIKNGADIAFFRLLDDLWETTFKSPWTELEGL